MLLHPETKKIPVMWISLEYDEKNKLVSAEGKKCFFSDLKGDDIERIRRIGRSTNSAALKSSNLNRTKRQSIDAWTVLP